jgi:hypothetical protein
MSVHRYDPQSTRADLRRAAIGVILTAGPIPFVAGSGTVATMVLGLLAVLFLAFGLRTVLRGMTLVHVTEHGLSSDPSGGRGWDLPGLTPRTIAWRDIRKVGLRFFSLKRDRSEGWMELSLGDGGRSLRLDSTLDGFKDIVARAADSARANGLTLSDSTQANLASLGIRTAGWRGGDTP